MIGYLPQSTQRIINEECSEGHEGLLRRVSMGKREIP